jgi:hypothetical protein
MRWGNGGEAPEGDAPPGRQRLGPIRVERDAPRPATILKVATELEERGAEIKELFKEIRSPLGEVALPIHVVREEGDFFVEVETGPCDPGTTEQAINKAAVLRGSEHAAAGLEVLSAYPVPREIWFFFGRSPAALLQLALTRVSPENPQEAARLFREAASRHWDVDLDYEPGYLPLVEELLMAALDVDEAPPILDELVVGLGCFVGETIRRSTEPPVGSWRTDEDWGEGPVIEAGGFVLDPVGKSRAFLREGPDDSVAFYADYVLEQLEAGGERAPDPAAGDAQA